MANVVTPGSPEARQPQGAAEEEDVDLEKDDETDGGADDSDKDDDDDSGVVTFESKDAFAKHVNAIVKKRLARNEQKYAPIVAERDTLKKRVDELSGADKDKSDAERQIAALTNQVKELTSYQQATQRNELVREIAKEKGLPEEFYSRVQGNDPDSITEDVEELVELLKVDTKTPRIPKNLKPDEKNGKGGKGSHGKGGSEDDDKNDPAEIAKQVGRYGHRPIFVG